MNKRAQAINILRKHAALFSSPKWMTDPNWTKDEEAVNDWFDNLSPSGKYHSEALETYSDLGDNAVMNLVKRYNLGYRGQRVDDKTAYFIDKLRDLGIIDKKYHDILLKIDRGQALYKAWFEYVNAVEENPNLEKIYKNFDWNKSNNAAYLKSLEKTPYGKELQSLYEDIYNYQPTINSPMTRKDTGSVLDATPYQLEKWTRDANSSVLLEGLKGALKRGLQGAGIGALIGARAVGRADRDRDVADMLPGAALVGIPIGLLAGTVGGISSALKARRKKLDAQYRLNEQPIE